MQMAQFLNPTTEIGGGGLGSKKRDLLIVLHDLLLSCEVSLIKCLYLQSVTWIGEVLEAFSWLLRVSSVQLRSATVVFSRFTGEFTGWLTGALQVGYRASRKPFWYCWSITGTI